MLHFYFEPRELVNICIFSELHNQLKLQVRTQAKITSGWVEFTRVFIYIPIGQIELYVGHQRKQHSEISTHSYPSEPGV